MIDIRDFEAFVAIIDGGSLSKAADELGLTQPALSLKLKKMETELGVKLFQRTPRNMVPLDAARTIEPKVRDILTKFDAVREALVESVSDLRGQVRLGCVLGWYDALVVPVLGQVCANTPGMRLRLHVDQTDQLIHMVSHGKLDLAIVAQPFENSEGLAVERLLDENLVLFGRNLKHRGTDAERRRALLSRPWVTMNTPDPLVDKYWREQFNGPFPWDAVNVPVSVDHILTVPQVVLSIPDALAVLPLQIVSKFVKEGKGEIAESVLHRNGLFLVWRGEGLELKRDRLVRDLIVAQVKKYQSEIQV